MEFRNILLALFASLCHVRCQKNVLFVVVDDLRPALGCYQDPDASTPNIDSLASKSTIFTKAYAQQALCAPSRNSLLTSRRPDSLYLYDTHSYWRIAAGNFTTIPQHFRNHGYFTASFGKIFHPGSSSNHDDDANLSWSVPPFHPSTIRYKNSKVCRQNEKGDAAASAAAKNLLCPVEPRLQPEGTLPDMQTTQAATDFLLHYNRSDPFFLAVGFHKPHIPFKFPKKYLDIHPLDKMSHPVPSIRPPGLPNVAWNPWTDLRERDDVHALNLTFPFEPIPSGFTQKIRQHYHAAVSYVDDLFGQILTTLEEKNLIDKTIIVLFGDHGWSMGEHEEWAKYSNFENALRVPLIIYDPEHTTTKRSTADLAELVDIFPTLCDLTSLPPPPPCFPSPTSQDFCSEGHSLAHLLSSSGGLKRKGAFSQYPRPGPYPEWNSDQPRLRDIRTMGYTVRTDRFRYTEWVRFCDLTPDWKEIEGEELYDHDIDPFEGNNLAGRKGLEDLQSQLRKLLRDGWRVS